MKKLLYLSGIIILALTKTYLKGQGSVTMNDNTYVFYGTASPYSCVQDPSRSYSVNGEYGSGQLFSTDEGEFSGKFYMINGRPAFKKGAPFDATAFIVYNGVCLSSFSGGLIIWWTGSNWAQGFVGQTGPTQFDISVSSRNGFNTFLPPCEGWSWGTGGYLTGDCQAFSVTFTAPTGETLADTRKTRSTEMANGKNAFEIPFSDGTGFFYVSWDNDTWVMKKIISNPGARIAEEVVSVSTGDNGANPPCTGWTNGYGLGGAICEGGEAGIPLPVNLVSFDAQVTPVNLVKLNWSTAQEQDAGYFGLERSRDAFNFAEIAKVQAKGDSYEIKSYIHTDETPLRGRSYYRLRQVDRDGSHTYSKTVSVRTSDTDSPYPNPARNGVIRLEAARGATLRLTDLSGREIPFIAQRIDEALTEIRPAQNLQPGVYVVSIDGTGHRVVVER